MLAQDCLDRCSDVPEAIALLEQTPVANGAIVTLVDASGRRAAIELAGEQRLARRTDQSRIIAVFNKYQEPDLVRREIPVGAVTKGIWAGYDVHACNRTRQRRFDELARHEHRYTDADINALLADHDGGAGNPDTICRHGDPLNETILTAIIEPRVRALQVSFGKACRAVYQRYLLEPERFVQPGPSAPAQSPQGPSISPTGSGGSSATLST
jgi:hypothetical protein